MPGKFAYVLTTVFLLSCAFIILAVLLPLVQPAEKHDANFSYYVRQPLSVPECAEGDKTGCSPGGCKGYKICREGRWSECVTERVCAPGDKTGCFVNSCETGYAVCNACGTAYENCTAA